MRILFVCFFLFFTVINSNQYYSQVNSVRIEKNQNGFELYKNNEPYYRIPPTTTEGPLSFPANVQRLDVSSLILFS